MVTITVTSSLLYYLKLQNISLLEAYMSLLAVDSATSFTQIWLRWQSHVKRWSKYFWNRKIVIGKLTVVSTSNYQQQNKGIVNNILAAREMKELWTSNCISKQKLQKRRFSWTNEGKWIRCLIGGCDFITFNKTFIIPFCLFITVNGLVMIIELITNRSS